MRPLTLLGTLTLMVACSGPSSLPPPPNTSRASTERPPPPRETPPPVQQDPPPPVLETPPVAQQVSPPSAPPSIVWRLDVLPPSFAMSQRDRVRIRILAINTGTATADPGRDPLEIRVNGQRSMEADLAFGNGGREARWSALPAGESVNDSRVGLGIFPRPGDYDLVLHVPSGDVAHTRVHVTAGEPHATGDS